MALHVDITVRKMFVLCYKFVQRDYEVFARFSEINQSTQIPTSHLLYETLGPIYEQKSKSPTSCGKVRPTLLFFSQCSLPPAIRMDVLTTTSRLMKRRDENSSCPMHDKRMAGCFRLKGIEKPLCVSDA